MYIVNVICVFQAARDTPISNHSGEASQFSHIGDSFKLKEWLEFQFREQHRKIDAISETQSHLKVKRRVEGEKIHCCVHE